ncbi:MAG: hypothetical protein JAY75_24335, partial [Candidatus Thiodiazotropha taylori]|nr:hypothetical protein [Candidatus Thiodiazotropha taylori]MCW4226629.1 hypothetical protein [Candidatus Thiodiazotropha endolucinida]MCG7882183.1 hypothetical protein [Candidatus Thiodiazotropha taylori]MCG7888191.1 hypothetical protein [Candidatus Thiodiazotropha taylori]MCG8033567.1 hypothetical protein [Candidatus Thiodiazotropha taylori]
SSKAAEGNLRASIFSMRALYQTYLLAGLIRRRKIRRWNSLDMSILAGIPLWRLCMVMNSGPVVTLGMI